MKSKSKNPSHPPGTYIVVSIRSDSVSEDPKQSIQSFIHPTNHPSNDGYKANTHKNVCTIQKNKKKEYNGSRV